MNALTTADHSMSQTLALDGVSIRQDGDGRFCLNDLHRASGGEKRHGPSYWLHNSQTQDLIREMETTGIPAVETYEGSCGGTYVAKELVYSYAMWISAAFNLKVIRAYDSNVSRPAELSRMDILKLAMESEEARIKAEAERDEAIRTKAQISDKKTATAMATAANATRRANALEIQLDRSMQYSTVKRMQQIHKGQKFDWRLLKGVAAGMGIASIDVPDANYETVKAYHADVWRRAYGLSIKGGDQ